MRGTHRALRLQCRDLDLFAELFDPRSLIVAGDMFNLATIRARKAATGRRSAFVGDSRGPTNRLAPLSRDSTLRKAPPLRSDHGRGSGSYVHKKPNSSSSNKFSDSRVVNGVNQKVKADFFWDMNDPEIGWKKGRSIVGNFDMVHLMAQSTDSFSHALAWNCCQGLSLASAIRVREEKLRNDQSKLQDEVFRLKEEKRRLSEEKEKANVELIQVQSKLVDQLKAFAVLEEKHAFELKTGGQFLDSEASRLS